MKPQYIVLSVMPAIIFALTVSAHAGEVISGQGGAPSATQAAAPDAPSAEETSSTPRIEVAVLGYGVNTDLAADIRDFVEAEDSGLGLRAPQAYQETSGSVYDSRPAWMAKNQPTIFYYNNDNRSQVLELQKKLKEKFGINFAIKKGAGRGITEPETTVMIHIVPAN